LLDLTLSSDIICYTESNIMVITNFEKYKRSEFSIDFIEIIILATVQSTTKRTNPLGIFTYIDANYLQLVDVDIESESTRFDILTARKV
jgi:hypothetical protein